MGVGGGETEAATPMKRSLQSGWQPDAGQWRQKGKEGCGGGFEGDVMG